MANFIPVAIALLTTMFYQNDLLFKLWLVQGDQVTMSNGISRILILMSTFLLILDNQILPDRYRIRINKVGAMAIDYVVAHVAMASMLYVWTQFQSMLCMLLKELLLLENDPQHLVYHQLGGDIFLGFFTTAMSIITLWYSFKATGSKERFKTAFFTCVDAIVDVSLKICDCSDDENDMSKKQ